MSSKKPQKTTLLSSEDNGERRQYNSPLRRRQSAETRQRIIEAGAELAHESPTWDWKNLTFRAVSERADVSERTVYRHFATEKLLRDAVVAQLVDDADINMEELNLSDFAPLVCSVFETLSTFAAVPEPMLLDPTFSSLDQTRHQALLNAIGREAPTWKEDERAMAAATLDLMWNPYTYNLLVASWGFDIQQANRTSNWLIGLIEDAIRQGQKP